MWPFDRIIGRRYERTLHASLIVFLGNAVYERLPPETQRRVTTDVEGRVSAHLWPFSLSSQSFEALGALRALAMFSLGIEPAVDGMRWPELFRFWGRRSYAAFGLPNRDVRSDWVLGDVRPNHPATREARKILEAKGLQLGRMSREIPETH